jgi:hypothetical protein
MIDELPAVPLETRPDPAMRAFLVAQLEWERHHASRLRLVHVLAFAGLCLCLVVGLGSSLRDRLHIVAVAAWILCFGVTGMAAARERRWKRRRDDCVSALTGNGAR